MCLGIPMEIREIDGFTARCEAKGVERDVIAVEGEHVEEVTTQLFAGLRIPCETRPR